MSERIDFGILGARRAYELLSANILPTQFCLLAICETDPDEYTEFAPIFERLGIPVFPRFSSMLEAIDKAGARRDRADAAAAEDAIVPQDKENNDVIDTETGEKVGKSQRNDHKAVFIAGNPKSHAKYSQKALSMGFDVLCEPPIVLSPAEAFRIERVAYEGIHGRRVFALAEPECFAQRVLLARSIIRNGKLGAVRFAQVERIEQLDPPKEAPRTMTLSELTGTANAGEAVGDANPIPEQEPLKTVRKFLGPIDCSASLGVLLFVTELRAKSLEMTMQSRLSGGKCELYSLGVELTQNHGGVSAPGSANANCVYGTLSSPTRSDLRIFCEKGSIEFHGKHIMLHDYSTGKLNSVLYSYEGLELPGMAQKFKSEKDYREALMFAGFALRVLNLTHNYCIELYDAFDIAITGIMARRMLADGTKQRVRIPDLRVEADRHACRLDKG